MVLNENISYLTVGNSILCPVTFEGHTHWSEYDRGLVTDQFLSNQLIRETLLLNPNHIVLAELWVRNYFGAEERACLKLFYRNTSTSTILPIIRRHIVKSVQNLMRDHYQLVKTDPEQEWVPPFQTPPFSKLAS